MAKKNQPTQTALVISLAMIVAAGENGTLAQLSEVQDFANDGLVELNPAGPDQDGNIGVRATAAGVAQVNGQTQSAAPAALKYVIESGIDVPQVSTGPKRVGVKRESKYPFALLEIGQSFFVALEKGNMGSQVANANDSFSEEIPGEFRIVKGSEKRGTQDKQVPAKKYNKWFVQREVVENGVRGSRVWRVAVPTKAATEAAATAEA